MFTITSIFSPLNESNAFCQRWKNKGNHKRLHVSFMYSKKVRVMSEYKRSRLCTSKSVHNFPLNSGDAEPQLSPTGQWCPVCCHIITSEYPESLQSSLQMFFSIPLSHLLPKITVCVCVCTDVVCNVCALCGGVFVCVCLCVTIAYTYFLRRGHFPVATRSQSSYLLHLSIHTCRRVSVCVCA